MNKTSFQVYFNLNDEDEKLMHEYLKNRNKNFVVKRLLLNEIKGVGFELPKEEESDEDYGDIFNQ